MEANFFSELWSFVNSLSTLNVNQIIALLETKIEGLSLYLSSEGITQLEGIKIKIWAYLAALDIKRFINAQLVLEYTATITGFVYLIYLIKEKSIAWIFGGISSLILVYLYFIQAVYLQSILSIFYAGMAVYGFILWKQKDSHHNKSTIISEYPFKTHLVIILINLLISMIMAVILRFGLKAQYSTIDALIFCFSMTATYMQTKKIISNWIYWIIINSFSTLLCLYLGLYSVALLMIVYTILAIVGYKKWKKLQTINQR